VSDLWTSAHKAASDAHFLFEGGRYDGACNRAYYAMFNVARVLLMESEDHAVRKIKTHASAIRMFSLKFIRNGLFDTKFGELLGQARNLRGLVDYEGEAMTADDAKEIIETMDQFLAIAASVRSKAQQQ
jgi:uncharacterized protein (UPF0332 family)